MCDIIGMRFSIPITMLVIYMFSTFEVWGLRFENYVNYAGSKTHSNGVCAYDEFENYVNYAGSKTLVIAEMSAFLFENYVNYAGSKTIFL